MCTCVCVCVYRLLYVSLMVIIKQEPIADTYKKMKKESKYNIIESYQNTREERKIRIKG